MTRRSTEPDLYEVLGVPTDVDAGRLRQAYRRRLHRLHPDVGGESTDAQREAFARVQHAYQVLRDPDRRAQYDAERGIGPPRTDETARRRGTRADAGVAIRIGPLRIDLGF